MPGDDFFAHSLRHSHLDGVVAAHAIVRTLTSLAVHSPLTIHLVGVRVLVAGALTESPNQRGVPIAKRGDKYTRHLPRKARQSH
jgi:hypothetical protein